MKSILITFDQAHYERIVDTLSRMSCRGFTLLDQVKGRGTVKGEPHFGSHAWPAMCAAIFAMVEDEKVDQLLERLHGIDVENEQLGLRAFVWNIEKSI